MRLKKLGPVGPGELYARWIPATAKKSGSTLPHSKLLRFFFEPLFPVFGGSFALIGDDAGGARRDAGIARGASGFHAGVQNFFLAAFHGFICA
jgi:hypothetical protein